MNEEKNNTFVGMSAEELQIKRNLFRMTIENYECNIAKLEKQIEDFNKSIQYYNEQIKMVDEAEKETSQIQFTTILKVYREERDIYIGKTPRSYYSSYDWKKTVVYKYSVYNCNLHDNNKAITTLSTSIESGYNMTEREMLLEDIISEIEEYNVEKIIIDKGVRLSQAKLKNHCSNIERIA